MKVPLLNFVGGPGVPLLNFEGGPGVSLLNFRGVRGPLLNFEGVPGSRGLRSRGPGPTFTPCQKFVHINLVGSRIFLFKTKMLRKSRL